MSCSRQWRYKMFLGLMILYMASACIVALTLLWTTMTQYRIENLNDKIEDQYLVPICAPSKMDTDTDPHNNCDLLDSLRYEKFIANGWTKIVYSAKVDSQSIAIKTVNLKGKDVVDCAKTNPVLVCHNKAVEKLVREISLLKQLNHATIIQLKHYCSKTAEERPCMKYAVIATEIGEPLTNLKLLQMTWNQRRQIIVDLATLVNYAQESPIGVLGLPDLRRPQFVLVNGHMKLTDLDDIIVGEPSCATNDDCSNFNITIKCISSRCEGYNSKLNIQKSFQEFGPYIFLMEGVPREKRMNLDRLRQLWQRNNVTTEQLLSDAKLL
ncbi:hypothetical protein GHT06_015368 [Daphnia sinensis]|uniref:Protein kinase domain-containing protein n=1 Tax=Daphnia sinensis TaxID=1820382 RepID=A0AAD5L9G3_9CRUS|nr:hypothetical protein GHT06_015368 [Daphnia sinensis]